MKQLFEWIEYQLKPLVWAIVHTDFRKVQFEITLPIAFQKPKLEIYIPYESRIKYCKFNSIDVNERIGKYIKIDEIPF